MSCLVLSSRPFFTLYLLFVSVGHAAHQPYYIILISFTSIRFSRRFVVAHVSAPLQHCWPDHYFVDLPFSFAGIFLSHSTCHHHHHHQAAVVSRGWAKASACCLQTTLSCAFLCHIVSLQYLSRSSLHRLAGLPCRLFLSYGLQLVTREVHRSSLRRLICPAQDHFIFLTVLIISMTFVLSLTQYM